MQGVILTIKCYIYISTGIIDEWWLPRWRCALNCRMTNSLLDGKNSSAGKCIRCKQTPRKIETFSAMSRAYSSGRLGRAQALQNSDCDGGDGEIVHRRSGFRYRYVYAFNEHSCYCFTSGFSLQWCPIYSLLRNIINTFLFSISILN